MIKILKKYFKNFSISGKHNKLISIKDGIAYNLSKFHSRFSINGNNNIILINCDKTKKIITRLPKGLSFNIKGNNNIIDLEFPLNIENVKISMNGDNNTFSIKSTKHLFANAEFKLAHQATINIGKDSEIYDGQFQCIITQNYKVPHKLIIGDGVHIARDTLIRTSDGQMMYDANTAQPLSCPKDIYIGNHVWIMTRCMIVKGANIPDGCAIAPYSFVNKQFTDKNSLIAGIPAKIIKNDINWSSYSYRGYMKALEKENRLNPKWELEGLESIPVIPKERLPKYKIHPLNPQIFSVTNQKRRNGKKHKVITLCGIKFKFKKR